MCARSRVKPRTSPDDADQLTKAEPSAPLGTAGTGRAPAVSRPEGAPRTQTGPLSPAGGSSSTPASAVQSRASVPGPIPASPAAPRLVRDPSAGLELLGGQARLH